VKVLYSSISSMERADWSCSSMGSGYPHCCARIEPELVFHLLADLFDVRFGIGLLAHVRVIFPGELLRKARLISSCVASRATPMVS